MLLSTTSFFTEYVTDNVQTTDSSEHFVNHGQVTYLDQWRHETSRQVKVRYIRHQTGVVLYGRLAMAHMWRVSIEAGWRWAKVWVLSSAPWRMLTPHARRREPLVGMVVRRRWRWRRGRTRQFCDRETDSV